ncbi:MAG: Lrp/AsnC ligand binding domain-containing protein [Candidatus Hodarchaeota archaeon]
MIAFVLLTTGTGFEKNVLEKIGSIDGVKEAYIVYGIYDIICKFQRTTIKALNNEIREKIQTLPNVRSTLTMNVLDGGSCKELVNNLSIK